MHGAGWSANPDLHSNSFEQSTALSRHLIIAEQKEMYKEAIGSHRSTPTSPEFCKDPGVLFEG